MSKVVFPWEQTFTLPTINFTGYTNLTGGIVKLWWIVNP